MWLCKGSAILAGYMRCDIAMLGSLGIDIIILSDPDREGRDIRIRLTDLLPQVCGVCSACGEKLHTYGGGSREEGRVQRKSVDHLAGPIGPSA